MKGLGIIWRAALILLTLALLERAVLPPGGAFSPKWLEASSGFMIGLALVFLVQRFRWKKQDGGACRQTPAS
jgi:membrane associated rhomboid family serine protease